VYVILRHCIWSLQLHLLCRFLECYMSLTLEALLKVYIVTTYSILFLKNNKIVPNQLLCKSINKNVDSWWQILHLNNYVTPTLLSIRWTCFWYMHEYISKWPEGNGEIERRECTNSWFSSRRYGRSKGHNAFDMSFVIFFTASRLLLFCWDLLTSTRALRANEFQQDATAFPFIASSSNGHCFSSFLTSLAIHAHPSLLCPLRKHASSPLALVPRYTCSTWPNCRCRRKKSEIQNTLKFSKKKLTRKAKIIYIIYTT
jgi:hypothetical protein